MVDILIFGIVFNDISLYWSSLFFEGVGSLISCRPKLAPDISLINISF